jgi:hypothetical protein
MGLGSASSGGDLLFCILATNHFYRSANWVSVRVKNEMQRYLSHFLSDSIPFLPFELYSVLILAPNLDIWLVGREKG